MAERRPHNNCNWHLLWERFGYMSWNDFIDCALKCKWSVVTPYIAASTVAGVGHASSSRRFKTRRKFEFKGLWELPWIIKCANMRFFYNYHWWSGNPWLWQGTVLGTFKSYVKYGPQANKVGPYYVIVTVKWRKMISELIRAYEWNEKRNKR